MNATTTPMKESAEGGMSRLRLAHDSPGGSGGAPMDVDVDVNVDEDADDATGGFRSGGSRATGRGGETMTTTTATAPQLNAINDDRFDTSEEEQRRAAEAAAAAAVSNILRQQRGRGAGAAAAAVVTRWTRRWSVERGPGLLLATRAAAGQKTPRRRHRSHCRHGSRRRVSERHGGGGGYGSGVGDASCG